MAHILPNDIIMSIIRLADGGHHTHKTLMSGAFDMITGDSPISFFEDGAGNTDCPFFIWESKQCGHVGTICDSDSDDEDDSEEDE